MAVQLVTCKKCKKIFDYDKTSGICPKCARFYSKTSYNEEEALLSNILNPSNEANCSYHNNEIHTGHNEGMHKSDSFSSGATYKAPGTTPNVITTNSHKANGSVNENTNKNGVAIVIIFIIIFISAILSSLE